MRHELVIEADPAAVASRAAKVVGECARASIAARGRFVLVLAGGSTPKALYRKLAEKGGENAAGEIDWSRVQILFGDERCTMPDHPDSNFKMASEALLEHVAIPAASVHRIRGELGAARAAEDYDGVVRRIFSEDPEGDIDLILLGMGGDGHTASLFPGRDFERDRGLLAAEAEAPPASPVKERVTLTLEAIRASRDVLFLTTGAEKREMLGRVLAAAEKGGDVALPASMISCSGRVQWLVDQAAVPVAN
jgi:6-phosphogluconolactonase